MNRRQEDFTQDLDLVETEDGSPSLNWAAGGTTETMHSRRGARSETDYIYGDALRWLAKQNSENPSVLVMGLGLGYIEMFAIALLDGRAPRLTSVEIDDHLRERFRFWLEGGSVTPYDRIASEVAKATRFEGLKEKCRTTYQEARWQFAKEISGLPKIQFQGVMYDAFSGQSQPDLWTEEFLSQTLEKHAAENCVFSTYAATGALKRALKKNAFSVQAREGFAHKRESTFATKTARALSAV